jgi:hypothetical protein
MCRLRDQRVRTWPGCLPRHLHRPSPTPAHPLGLSPWPTNGRHASCPAQSRAPSPGQTFRYSATSQLRANTSQHQYAAILQKGRGMFGPRNIQRAGPPPRAAGRIIDFGARHLSAIITSRHQRSIYSRLSTCHLGAAAFNRQNLSWKRSNSSPTCQIAGTLVLRGAR